MIKISWLLLLLLLLHDYISDISVVIAGKKGNQYSNKVSPNGKKKNSRKGKLDPENNGKKESIRYNGSKTDIVMTSESSQYSYTGKSIKKNKRLQSNGLEREIKDLKGNKSESVKPNEVSSTSSSVNKNPLTQTDSFWNRIFDRFTVKSPVSSVTVEFKGNNETAKPSPARNTTTAKIRRRSNNKLKEDREMMMKSSGLVSESSKSVEILRAGVKHSKSPKGRGRPSNSKESKRGTSNTRKTNALPKTQSRSDKRKSVAPTGSPAMTIRSTQANKDKITMTVRSKGRDDIQDVKGNNKNRSKKPMKGSIVVAGIKRRDKTRERDEPKGEKIKTKNAIMLTKKSNKHQESNLDNRRKKQAANRQYLIDNLKREKAVPSKPTRQSARSTSTSKPRSKKISKMKLKGVKPKSKGDRTKEINRMAAGDNRKNNVERIQTKQNKPSKAEADDYQHDQDDEVHDNLENDEMISMSSRPISKFKANLTNGDDDLEAKLENRKNQAHSVSYLKKLGLIKEKSKKHHPLGFVQTKVFGDIKSVSQRYYLEFKALSSSHFEKACLKGTRPDNNPPKEKYVSSIISTINNFNLEKSPNDDPYYIVLHKLWIRANFMDKRTNVKAIYILHRLFQSVHSHHVRELRTRMRMMSSSIICRATQSNYFDRQILENKSKSSSLEYHEFFMVYLDYVLYRGLTFSPSFEEFVINPADNGDSSCLSYLNMLSALLSNAQECIKRLVACSMDHLMRCPANDVTLPSIELLGCDLEVLYPLYECKFFDYFTMLKTLLQSQSWVRVRDIDNLSSMDSAIKPVKALHDRVASSNQTINGQVSMNETLHEVKIALKLLKRYEKLYKEVEHWKKYHAILLKKESYIAMVLELGEVFPLSSVKEDIQLFERYERVMKDELRRQFMENIMTNKAILRDIPMKLLLPR